MFKKQLSKFSKYRIAKNVTQDDLVKKVEQPKSIISLWENNKSLPTPSQAKIITDFLQCGLLDLFNLEDISFHNLGKTKEQQANNIADKQYRNIGFYIQKENFNILSKSNLKKLGYTTKTMWLCAKLAETKKQLADLILADERSKDDK